MKKHALPVLAGLNLVLALVLVWLWIGAQGHLRNVQWRAPAAQTTDYAAMMPALPGLAPADTSRFVAMLERPVFSPTRRPPEAKPASKEGDQPADGMGTARLLGLFQGAGDGGAIVLLGGKPRRVRLNDSVDGWKLVAVQQRAVTFERNGQAHSLQLPRATLASAPALPPAARPVLPAPSAPPRLAPAARPGTGPAGAKPRVPTFGGR
jgi:hypothetical protein